jgi:hypothetical protein
MDPVREEVKTFIINVLASSLLVAHAVNDAVVAATLEFGIEY